MNWPSFLADEGVALTVVGVITLLLLQGAKALLKELNEKVKPRD